MVTPLLLNLVATRFLFSQTTAKQVPAPLEKQTHKHSSYNAVGVFSHHRDVKVALEELAAIDFPLNKVSLIARNGAKHNWKQEELEICPRFNAKLLNIPESIRYLLHHYFNRGKYLVLVSGSEIDVEVARTILGRRPKHCEIWRW